jgi:L-asparagine oxygenase
MRSLPGNNIGKYQLSSGDISKIVRLMQNLEVGICARQDDFVRMLHLFQMDLPRALVEAVIDFRRFEDAVGMVIKGFPIPYTLRRSTPLAYGSDLEDGLDPDVIAFGIICSLLGEPIGFSAQQHGRLFNDVMPLKTNVEVPNISSGSAFEFSLHTEDAFHSCAPDYICWLCIRNPTATPLNVAAPDVSLMQPSDVELLRKEHFIIAANPLQEVRNVRFPPRAILWGDKDRPYMRINAAKMDNAAQSPLDSAALRNLLRNLAAGARSVDLAAGDIFILDNYRAAHGRSAYLPKFDGTDRWLKRLVVATDIRKSRDLRMHSTSRILDSAGRTVSDSG